MPDQLRARWSANRIRAGKPAGHDFEIRTRNKSLLPTLRTGDLRPDGTPIPLQCEHTRSDEPAILASPMHCAQPAAPDGTWELPTAWADHDLIQCHFGHGFVALPCSDQLLRFASLRK